MIISEIYFITGKRNIQLLSLPYENAGTMPRDAVKIVLKIYTIHTVFGEELGYMWDNNEFPGMDSGAVS